MTAHMCTTITPGCYRCDLNEDELQGMREGLIEDIVRAVYKASTEKLYVIEAVLDL